MSSGFATDNLTVYGNQVAPFLIATLSLFGQRLTRRPAQAVRRTDAVAGAQEPGMAEDQRRRQQSLAQQRLRTVQVGRDSVQQPRTLARVGTSVFASFAPCSLTPYETSASKNLGQGSAVTVSQSRVTVTLSAQSVTTFVGTP